MTAITLDRVWLSLAAQPELSVRIVWDGDRNYAPEAPVEVRRYAGGRFRSTTRTGVMRTASIPAVVWPADLALLESWRGRTLLYRDGLGQRWWCVITAMPWQPTANGKRRRVALQLSEVTYSEAV